jgi:hypothetical protein
MSKDLGPILENGSSEGDDSAHSIKQSSNRRRLTNHSRQQSKLSKKASSDSSIAESNAYMSSVCSTGENKITAVNQLRTLEVSIQKRQEELDRREKDYQSN